jgi:glutamate synthase domain-containing protein 3
VAKAAPLVPGTLETLGRAAVEAGKGVAEGAIISIPFEIGARPEEERNILGGVALGGAIRGGIVTAGGATRGAQHALAIKIFEAAKQRQVPESAEYGRDAQLDSAHLLA